MELHAENTGALKARNGLMSGRISRVDRGADAPDVAAKEMESLFATLLVTEMRKGLGEGFFGTGKGADTFNGWFDEQLGASIAQQGNLGIGEQVKESIIRQQAAKAAQAAEAAGEGADGGVNP
ncbi:MAG: rod-binding protein [Planctomycetota bacterium]|nr:rod-binding protein [Planctomycetota bacterium]MDG1983123.1 rod-binding protein [Planctomycetota bacterium]